MTTSKEKSVAKASKRTPAQSSRCSDYVIVTAAKGSKNLAEDMDLETATTLKNHEIPAREVKASKKPLEMRVHMSASMSPVEARIGHLLTGKTVKAAQLIGFVRDGLPVLSVERVMKGLGMESTESLLPIIGMSNRTYARRKQANQDLTPLESDRLYRLAKIESLAECVFGDKETANDWLQSPNRALGAVPLEMLDTEAGTEQVETILTRIEHGVFS